MLLSYKELVKLVETGVVENSCIDNVNGSSIDITLGADLLVEKRPANWEKNQVALWRKEERVIFEEDTCLNGFWIGRDQLILAHSVEVFNLPNNISAEYKLKSSLARSGLEHLAAGWCDPTWHGSSLTLELSNMTRFYRLGIRAGMKIGQMIFFKHEEVPVEVSYATRGKYNMDKTVSRSKGVS